jgi:hypothetical protein
MTWHLAVALRILHHDGAGFRGCHEQGSPRRLAAGAEDCYVCRMVGYEATLVCGSLDNQRHHDAKRNTRRPASWEPMVPTQAAHVKMAHAPPAAVMTSRAFAQIPSALVSAAFFSCSHWRACMPARSTVVSSTICTIKQTSSSRRSTSHAQSEASTPQHDISSSVLRAAGPFTHRHALSRRTPAPEAKQAQQLR